MKIAIFYFTEVTKEILWNRKDAILFNEKGWWIIEGNNRINVDIEDLTDKINYEYYSSINIIKKLRKWGPLWSRWCGKGDQYELLLRDALVLIMRISEGLKLLKIDKCIMHTGIAHHIDSVIFQMACEEVGIKVIYLLARTNFVSAPRLFRRIVR